MRWMLVLMLAMAVTGCRRQAPSPTPLSNRDAQAAADALLVRMPAIVNQRRQAIAGQGASTMPGNIFAVTDTKVIRATASGRSVDASIELTAKEIARDKTAVMAVEWTEEWTVTLLLSDGGTWRVARATARTVSPAPGFPPQDETDNPWLAEAVSSLPAPP